MWCTPAADGRTVDLTLPVGPTEMTITITLAADGEPLTTDVSRTTLQPSQSVVLDYESAEVQFVPTMRTPVDLEGAQKALRLIDALEDSDDVQAVYSNLDIPDDVAAQLDED